MSYSNYVDGKRYKPTRFEVMRVYLDRASKKEGQVYVIAMSRENYMHPEEVTEKLKNLDGVYNSLWVNGTINSITSGTKEKAEALAKKIHIETGEDVVAVPYERENIISFYVKIKHAIATMRKKDKRWYSYDPKTDSLDALLERVEQGVNH